MNTLVLYDDEAARGFEPFALTRPCCELRAGALATVSRAFRGDRAPWCPEIF